MAKLLEGGIADIVNKAAGSFFLNATLTRSNVAVGGSAFEPAVSTSETTYTCKAIEDKWSAGVYGSGLVNSTDIRILVLAASLATTPVVGDRITIRGVTLTILPSESDKLASIQTDPARATWSLRCG